MVLLYIIHSLFKNTICSKKFHINDLELSFSAPFAEFRCASFPCSQKNMIFMIFGGWGWGGGPSARSVRSVRPSGPSARSVLPPGLSFRPVRPSARSFHPVRPSARSVLPPGPSFRPVLPPGPSVRPVLPPDFLRHLINPSC